MYAHERGGVHTPLTPVAGPSTMDLDASVRHATGEVAVVTGSGVQVIPVSEDSVVLKRGVTELLVSGAGAVGLVQEVLASLAGAQDDAELLDRLPQVRRSDAAQLLAALRLRGLAGAPPVSAGQEETPLQALFEALSADGLPAEAALREAHVRVRGHNAVADLLARDLQDLGVGEVETVSDPLLDTGAGTAFLDSGAGDSPEPGATRPREGTASVDLEVATSVSGLSEGLLQANAAAVAAGHAYLPVWVEGPWARVGPLVVPHESACLHCHDRQRALAGAWFGDADDVGVAAPLAAHLAAAEVLKLVAGHPPSDAVGRALGLDTSTWRSSAVRVLKLPRCPVCSDVAGRGQPAVLVGPQIPMRWVGQHE